jgi:hypothetical protein
MRHINVRYHYIRDSIKSGIIVSHYTPINEILADGFTKTLDCLKFAIFVSFINMRDLMV